MDCESKEDELCESKTDVSDSNEAKRPKIDNSADSVSEQNRESRQQQPSSSEESVSHQPDHGSNEVESEAMEEEQPEKHNDSCQNSLEKPSQIDQGNLMCLCS